MKEHLTSTELIKENIISSEDFVEKLNKILDDAEEGFFKKYNRYPELDNEEDYVLLADFLNMTEQDSIFGDFDKVQGTSPTHLLDINNCPGGVLSHDLGKLLVKRFIKRKGFFIGDKQNEILEAIIGNRYYNAPRNEYVTRMNVINDLIKNHIPFPADWDKFIEELKEIKKACFLNELQDSNKHEKGYKKIGTFIVNPVGGMISNLNRIKNWEDLEDFCKRFAGKI